MKKSGRERLSLSLLERMFGINAKNVDDDACRPCKQSTASGLFRPTYESQKSTFAGPLLLLSNMLPTGEHPRNLRSGTQCGVGSATGRLVGYHDSIAAHGNRRLKDD